MTPATPSFGDSLNVMTEQLAAASVDLIYLDPPFNSKRDYNMLLRGKAQASVFQDTWRWSLRLRCRRLSGTRHGVQVE